MARLVKDEPLRPLGYEQITALSAATGLTVPSGAHYALVQATAQAIRWRDDGTDPTAAVGMPLLVDEALFYTGELRSLRFIEQAASAEVNVVYYA